MLKWLAKYVIIFLQDKHDKQSLFIQYVKINTYKGKVWEDFRVKKHDRFWPR